MAGLCMSPGSRTDLVPISHARSREAMAEERRLLYVALSVVRKTSSIAQSAKSRTFGTRTMVRDPSPWLVGIDNVRKTLDSRLHV